MLESSGLNHFKQSEEFQCKPYLNAFNFRLFSKPVRRSSASFSLLRRTWDGGQKLLEQVWEPWKSLIPR
jgi:hypothetical protein